MKIPIFIGSASESKGFAEGLKKYLDSDYDVVLWSNGFFGAGDITYEKLTQSAVSFKYAVMVGGCDDLVGRMSSGVEQFKPRDNVYFELGLFSGMLSPKRVFFAVDKDAQVASDFYGVTLLQYDTEKNLDTEAKRIAEEIKKLIEHEEKNYRNTLLPSYGLAVGYFENYLKPVCEQFHLKQQIIVEKRNYSIESYKTEFVVALPAVTDQDWVKWAAVFYEKIAPQKAIVKTLARNCDLNTQMSLWKKNNKCTFYNVPLTMNVAFQAIEDILNQGRTVTSDEKIRAKELEKEVFVGTLRVLIDQDAVVRKYVRLEEYDIS